MIEIVSHDLVTWYELFIAAVVHIEPVPDKPYIYKKSAEKSLWLTLVITCGRISTKNSSGKEIAHHDINA